MSQEGPSFLDNNNNNTQFLYSAYHIADARLYALVLLPWLLLVQFKPAQLSCAPSQLPGEHTSQWQPYDSAQAN